MDQKANDSYSLPYPHTPNLEMLLNLKIFSPRSTYVNVLHQDQVTLVQNIHLFPWSLEDLDGFKKWFLWIVPHFLFETLKEMIVLSIFFLAIYFLNVFQSLVSELRSELGCLVSTDSGLEVNNSILRLEDLITQRLILTQRFVDSLDTHRSLAYNSI